MIKTKNKRQKLIKRNSYKKYWNKLIELLKVSKQSYHQKYFEENKRNSKETYMKLYPPEKNLKGY